MRNIGEKILQELLNKIRQHLKNIPSNYEKTEECAFLIRSALALSIHVFYYKKYGTEVYISSSLNDSIKDSRFKSAFWNKMMILSDIQSIRITCNNIIHSTNTKEEYSKEEMIELHKRLLNCINAIAEKAEIQIIDNIPTSIVSTKGVSIQTKTTTNTNDDEKAKEVFVKAKLIEGTPLRISGIQEFVEHYFNQSKSVVKAIMQTRWIIPYYDKEIVWVVKMVNSEPATQGSDWINVYKNDEIFFV